MNSKKNRALMAAGIVLTAGIVVVNVSLSRKKVAFGDLTKANIEALANGESGGSGNEKICYYQGTSKYADYYECTSSYPGVGSCGNTTRIYKYFSGDKHVCNY
jgi:hypothetical protein